MINTEQLPTSQSIASSDTIVSNVSSDTAKVEVSTLFASDVFTNDMTQASVDAVVTSIWT